MPSLQTSLLLCTIFLLLVNQPIYIYFTLRCQSKLLDGYKPSLEQNYLSAPPSALLKSDFCSAVSLEGKIMSNLIKRFPFLLGSFEIGIPSFGITISWPGFTISVAGIARFLPSKVAKLKLTPVRASNSNIFWLTTRSFPSLLKIGWGFSSTTNIKSAGVMPGSWLPFSGKVILVPFFQPGLISIFKISSTVFGLLQNNCLYVTP